MDSLGLHEITNSNKQKRKEKKDKKERIRNKERVRKVGSLKNSTIGYAGEAFKGKHVSVHGAEIFPC